MTAQISFYLCVTHELLALCLSGLHFPVWKLGDTRVPMSASLSSFGLGSCRMLLTVLTRVSIHFWNNHSVLSQLLPPVPNTRTRGQKSIFLGQFHWHLAGCHLVLDSSCHLSVLARRFKIASVTFSLSAWVLLGDGRRLYWGNQPTHFYAWTLVPNFQTTCFNVIQVRCWVTLYIIQLLCSNNH